MRAFLILSCYAAFSYARPDVSLGYNYKPTASNDNYVGSPPSSPGGSGYNYEPSFAVDSSASLSSNSFASSSQSIQETVEPLITKHFYIHSAHEEPAGETITKTLKIGRPQKHYRILFINAPSYQSGTAHLSAEYAPSEEKTVIYVLSKTPEELKFDDIEQPQPTEPTKPEVYFIKYKTKEEAIHAQHVIQAQFEKLGGTSELSDEGQAPVSSVIGSLDSRNGGSSSETSSSTSTSSSEPKTYLPPSHK